MIFMFIFNGDFRVYFLMAIITKNARITVTFLTSSYPVLTQWLTYDGNVIAIEYMNHIDTRWDEGRFKHVGGGKEEGKHWREAPRG